MPEHTKDTGKAFLARYTVTVTEIGNEYSQLKELDELIACLPPPKTLEPTSYQLELSKMLPVTVPEDLIPTDEDTGSSENEEEVRNSRSMMDALPTHTEQPPRTAVTPTPKPSHVRPKTDVLEDEYDEHAFGVLKAIRKFLVFGYDSDDDKPKTIQIPTISESSSTLLNQKFRDPCSWTPERCVAPSVMVLKTSSSLDRSYHQTHSTSDLAESIARAESIDQARNGASLTDAHSAASDALDEFVLPKVQRSPSVSTKNSVVETKKQRSVRFEDNATIENTVGGEEEDDENTMDVSHYTGCSGHYSELQVRTNARMRGTETSTPTYNHPQKKRLRRQRQRESEDFSLVAEFEDLFADCTYIFKCLTESCNGSEKNDHAETSSSSPRRNIRDDNAKSATSSPTRKNKSPKRITPKKITASV